MTNFEKIYGLIIILLLIIVFIIGFNFFKSIQNNYLELTKLSCKSSQLKNMYGILDEIKEFEDKKVLCHDLKCEEYFDDKISKRNKVIEIISELNCDELISSSEEKKNG